MRPVFVLTLLAFGCTSETAEPTKPKAPAAKPTPSVAPEAVAALIEADAPKAGATAKIPLPPVPVVEGAGELKVVVATPKGVVRGMVRPTITFDKPVNALGARDAAETAPPATIEPKVAGRWKWLGSASVEFQPTKPMPRSTSFAVRVPAGLKAADGSTLSQPYSYVFETPRLRAQGGSPVNRWSKYAWAKPDQVFEIVFDHPPRPASVKRGLRVRAAGEDWGVEVLGTERTSLKEARDAGRKPELNDSDRRTTVKVKAERPLPLDRDLKLVFTRDLQSSEGPLAVEKEVEWAFRTYGQLKVESLGCQRWHGTCPKGPLSIKFSNPVSQKALKAAIRVVPQAPAGSVEPQVKLRWGDDDKRESNDWSISGNFAPASVYTVTLTGLKDIFGQPLETHTAPFKTGDFSPSFGFIDDNALLERTQRLAVPLTHVNIPSVQVGWAAMSLKEAMPWLQKPWRKEVPKGLKWRPHALPGSKNATLRSPLDLAPAFAGAKDPEQIAVVRLKWKEGRYKNKASTIVQVTDLGVHFKTSPVSSAAWVWRLSDGKSVANATVEVLDEEGKVRATAKTDAGGVANLPGVDAMGFSTTYKSGGRRSGPPFMVLRARTAEDGAFVTTRERHHLSPYRFGLREDWENTPATAAGFIFADRGIYRPGEALYIKGFLRTRSLGKFHVPKGEVAFELRGPDNKVVEKATGRISDFGGVDAKFTLPAEGRLGTYRIKASSGKLSWWTEARMAEYRPPKFLVEVRPKAEQRYRAQPVEAVIEGRYLFGAAMSKAQVNWTMTAKPGSFEPSDDQGFTFGKRLRWWESDDASSKHIADGEWTLDDAGRFEVKAGPAETPDDRPMTYTVEAAVTDVDRQVSAGRAAFPVHPASFYVGVRGPKGFATSGEAFEVEVLARDAVSQAKVPVKGVHLRLVRHVWNRVKKKNAWGGFETVSEKQEIEVETCTIDAPAKCTFTAKKSGHHAIVAAAKDAEGRKTLTSEGLWVVGPGYAAWLQDDDNSVEVVSDKATYDVGDTARLLVQSPFPEAEAWVTVEREGVLKQERMLLKGTATPIEVKIDESMIPNVFVGVVLARGRVAPGGKPGDPGRPAFRVGYRELRVVQKHKRLDVKLTPDAPEKRPGEELSIAVKVANHAGKGQVSEVAVWAVDEGVLSLTGYKTPDPMAELYRRRGLSVQQMSNLTALVPQLAYGDKGRDAGGGGGAAAAQELRSRFVTTPIFIGRTVTGADGSATVKGKLPDNLTTFRLMAVALTKTELAGSGESKVVVNKPLMARPALPRALRRGDRFAAGVVIHAKAAGEVVVKAKVVGAKGLGTLERRLSVPAGKGVEVRFPFEANAAGKAKLQFTVSGGGHSDGVEMTLPVKEPVDLETVAVYGDTDGQRVEAVQVPAEVQPDRGGLELSLASTALGGLNEDAKGLIAYPYGCLEQQSSRLVPFVALKSLLDRYGSDWLGQPAKEVVAKAVKAIAAMQLPSGGFAYWPGSRRPVYWATAHATFAVGEALGAGYDVHPIDLVRARKFLKKYFDKSLPGEWGKRSLESKAMALFVLARQGAPEPELERRVFAQRQKLALFGQALLASAMARPGASMARAKTLIGEIMNHARVEADSVHFAESDPFTYAPLFSSDTRSTAMVLTALLAADPKHAFVPRVARYLLKARTGGGYRNTQEAAYSLLALGDYAKVMEPGTPDFTAKVQWAGQALLSRKFDAKTLATPEPDLLPMAKLLEGKGERKLGFALEGTGRLYYSARLRFAPKAVATQPRDDGITVQRWYTFAKGEDRVKAVEEGALVKVHLRLATAKVRHYVALVDAIPAGLEPVDASLLTSVSGQGASGGSSSMDGRRSWWSVWSHSEMRDDRVLLFADRMPPGVHTYSYMARATTAGTFVMPPARAEEMYAPEISGRSEGGTFWIHPRAEISLAPRAQPAAGERPR